MSAKEMFEKLGYEKIEDAMHIEYYNGRPFKNEIVRFWKKSKHIELFKKATPDIYIDDNYDILIIEYYENYVEIFKAINKQIEELGWNER